MIFRIERSLGRGSFGITYLAVVESEDSLLPRGTRVAVKEFFMYEINDRSEDGTVTTASGSTAIYNSYRDKFVREARNLARLRHRGIVSIYDLWKANNTAYYAMEVLDRSLDDFIRDMPASRLPEWTALEIASTIARSVSYMHSLNMVHLDIKPGNIMLRGDDPVLIDFGLSKQYDADGNPESHTHIGGGTPGYAPMEQLGMIHTGRLPVTMDVYAMGATLYKLLTGKTPPTASDIFNDGFNSALLRDVGVSDTTIAIVRRAMQPRQADRYQSMSDMLDALVEAMPVEIVDDDAADGQFEWAPLEESLPQEPIDPRRTQRKPRNVPAEDFRPSDLTSPVTDSGYEPFDPRRTQRRAVRGPARDITDATIPALRGETFMSTEPLGSNQERREPVYKFEKFSTPIEPRRLSEGQSAFVTLLLVIIAGVALAAGICYLFYP